MHGNQLFQGQNLLNLSTDQTACVKVTIQGTYFQAMSRQSRKAKILIANKDELIITFSTK